MGQSGRRTGRLQENDGRPVRYFATSRLTGIFDIDSGLYKNFKMPYSERHVLQFRWETYNLTNSVQFNSVSVSLTSSSTFGLLSGQRVDPRQMQFAMRYDELLNCATGYWDATGDRSSGRSPFSARIKVHTHDRVRRSSEIPELFCCPRSSRRPKLVVGAR